MVVAVVMVGMVGNSDGDGDGGQCASKVSNSDDEKNARQ